VKQVFAIAQIVLKESYRRKDFYVLFILTVLLGVILGSLNFFNEQGIVRYLKEFSLLLIWLAALVMSLATSARQIPTEKESRTIFPLLAKPISRHQFFLGKFFGCWFSISMALFVFYLVFLLLTLRKDEPANLPLYFQAYVLHLGFLAVVIGLCLAGSVIFAAPSSNITILLVVILGITFLGPHLAKIAVKMAEPTQSILLAIYFVIPHFEFFDIRDLVVHSHPAVPWWAFGCALIYAMAYSAFFLVIGWLVFRHQTLQK